MGESVERKKGGVKTERHGEEAGGADGEDSGGGRKRDVRGFQQTCGVGNEHLVDERGETWRWETHAQSPTRTRVHSPDKGSAISGCLQSAAPPLVPPVSAVQQNKCLTLSENLPATANRAPPSICCVHAA